MEHTPDTWKNSCREDVACYGRRLSEKEQAVLQHSDMVRYMALRLLSRLPDHVSLDDLFSAGIIGLIDAIDKYDSSQGIPFRYYAKIRIRGAMLDEIRSMDWVPRSLRQKGSTLEKTCMMLEQREGHFPTDEEIAKELKITLDDYYKLLDETKGISLLPENINEAIVENGEAHFLATESDELFHCAHRREIQRHMVEAIRGLSEKEQLVLSLYYFEELTMKEVGAVMGYTESRISQIHTKAILKLRTRLSRKLNADDLPAHVGTADAGGSR